MLGFSKNPAFVGKSRQCVMIGFSENPALSGSRDNCHGKAHKVSTVPDNLGAVARSGVCDLRCTREVWEGESVKTGGYCGIIKDKACNN